MGCAVTIQVTASHQSDRVAGIAMHAPFTSFREAVWAFSPPWTYLAMPWFWLCDKWGSVDTIPVIPANIPVLVLSAGADKLVPPSQQWAVFQASSATSKWFNRVPGKEHTDVIGVSNHSVAELSEWSKVAVPRTELKS